MVDVIRPVRKTTITKTSTSYHDLENDVPIEDQK
jgi:hypothetical protein